MVGSCPSPDPLDPRSFGTDRSVQQHRGLTGPVGVIRSPRALVRGGPLVARLGFVPTETEAPEMIPRVPNRCVALVAGHAGCPRHGGPCESNPTGQAIPVTRSHGS